MCGFVSALLTGALILTTVEDAIGGSGMLNFEEELLKFQPSLEIDEAEEAIMNNDLTDLSDLLEQVTTGKKEKRQG